MKTHARTLIIALAALALAASSYALYVHYRMLSDPTYTSACNINETISCETVLTSQYGSVAGVPVAVGGAIWSALILLLAAFGMTPPRSEKVPLDSARGSLSDRRRPEAIAGYVFILATVGLAGILYLGYASFFILRQMCPICMTMYVAVIGLFVVSGAAASGLAALPGRTEHDLKAVARSPLAATLAIVWLVGSVALVAFFPREAPVADLAAADPVAPPAETLGADEISQFTAWMDVQPREELGVPANGAKVVVVKFNDYQCPACRQAYLAYRSLEQQMEMKYPGQVAFVNVDYPLESECNNGGIHGAACEAAVAVRLAKARNRGPEMEAWLFSNQEGLTRDRVKEALNDVAQVTDFDARYNEVLSAVRADAQLGQKVQITGTPTFFINGIRIGSTLRPAYMQAAIEHELKRAQAATQ
jgi:uncharacterized membrane protein